MKHFIDTNGILRALEDDGSQDFLIMEGWSKELTDEEVDAIINPVKTAEQLLEECLLYRSAAYKNESDPLKIEAEYNAISSGKSPDYTLWIAKVEEIKQRYPKP